MDIDVSDRSLDIRVYRTFQGPFTDVPDLEVSHTEFSDIELSEMHVSA